MFQTLFQLRPEWSGTLLLGVGLEEAGRALAFAVLAAGGAGLFLESDAGLLRAAQREGCCTFSVTNLAEAVRILKNEIRQGSAVTVALRGEPSLWLGEIVERGIQPQAIARARNLHSGEQESYGTLKVRGARALRASGLSQPERGHVAGSELLQDPGQTWDIALDEASTMAHRRDRDRLLLQAAQDLAGDQSAAGIRAVRWLREAPSLFPRSLQRAYLRPGSV